MSAFDRFRATGGAQGGDLASFFRSLVTPARRYGVSSGVGASSDFEWEQPRAQGGNKLTGGAKQLDFFDHGLSGTRGAEVVLRALVENPGATSISLSQNELGDNGLRALLVGMKQLRAKAIGGYLQELNLSGNNLTDVSLHLIALHLLQPSPHPPSLTHLYLTANDLSLSSTELSAFLGAALSSPVSALRCLSLTNNMSIGTAGLVSLLSHLHLGPASQLAQLHLSLCDLTPDCAEPLARWLEDPLGGSRLQVLGINGNSISDAGLRRIASSVISGKASSLIHLECHASDEAGEEWKEVVAGLSVGGQESENWEEQLEVVKERNKTVLKETRLAALGLLAKGRVLFGGNPHEPPIDAGAIRRGVEHLDPRDDLSSAPKRTNFGSSHFPFLHLPIELQVHILRCSLLLKPSSVAHLYPALDSRSAPSSTLTLSSPLTEHQFLNVLAHCASSVTLGTEMRISEAGGRVASLKHGWGQQDSWTGAESGGTGWEEWVLRKTECDRFVRP